VDLADFGLDLVAALLYGIVGVVLMTAGYGVLDLLIPGRLGELICRHRRRDVGIVVASGTLALGAIVTAAIFASEDQLGTGLAQTAGYGVIGIALLTLAFVVVDRLLPERLGEMLSDDVEDEPAAYVTGAMLLGVGAIIVGAIS